MRPRDGVKVPDTTTRLPGPLATLLLAESGAARIATAGAPHRVTRMAWRPGRRDVPPVATVNRAAA